MTTTAGNDAPLATWYGFGNWLWVMAHGPARSNLDPGAMALPLAVEVRGSVWVGALLSLAILPAAVYALGALNSGGGPGSLAIAAGWVTMAVAGLHELLRLRRIEIADGMIRVEQGGLIPLGGGDQFPVRDYQAVTVERAGRRRWQVVLAPRSGTEVRALALYGGGLEDCRRAAEALGRLLDLPVGPARRPTGRLAVWSLGVGLAILVLAFAFLATIGMFTVGGADV